MFFNKITGNTVGAGGTPPWHTALVLVCFLLILCLAAAFRVPRLTLRPVHGDEANQAVKTGILFDTGEYRYDPHEHHGPTLYYLTLPVLYFCGVSSFEDSITSTGSCCFRDAGYHSSGCYGMPIYWRHVWTALFMAVSLPMTTTAGTISDYCGMFVQAAFVSDGGTLKTRGRKQAIVLESALGFAPPKDIGCHRFPPLLQLC